VVAQARQIRLQGRRIRAADPAGPVAATVRQLRPARIERRLLLGREPAATGTAGTRATPAVARGKGDAVILQARLKRRVLEAASRSGRRRRSGAGRPCVRRSSAARREHQHDRADEHEKPLIVIGASMYLHAASVDDPTDNSVKSSCRDSVDLLGTGDELWCRPPGSSRAR
jgi:hypothetical protein